jgi:hypothetical protein
MDLNMGAQNDTHEKLSHPKWIFRYEGERSVYCPRPSNRCHPLGLLLRSQPHPGLLRLVRTRILDSLVRRTWRHSPAISRGPDRLNPTLSYRSGNGDERRDEDAAAGRAGTTPIQCYNCLQLDILVVRAVGWQAVRFRW